MRLILLPAICTVTSWGIDFNYVWTTPFPATSCKNCEAIQGATCILSSTGLPMCNCPADLLKSVYWFEHGDKPRCDETVWIVGKNKQIKLTLPHREKECREYVARLGKGTAHSSDANKYEPRFECFKGKHVSDMTDRGGYQCDFGGWRQGRLFIATSGDHDFSLLTYTGKKTFHMFDTITANAAIVTTFFRLQNSQEAIEHSSATSFAEWYGRPYIKDWKEPYVTGFYCLYDI